MGEARRGRGNAKKGKYTSLLELDGPGVPDLLCEAAASAKDVGLNDFSAQLWAKARKLAPLSKCVKTNWGLMHPGQTYEHVHGDWDTFRAFFAAGVTHEVQSHNGPAVRFATK